MTRPLRILVTGQNGQVARALAAKAKGSKDLALRFSSRDELDLATADAGRVSQFLREVAPDGIISAAAFTDVDGAERAPDAAFRLNSEAPRLLAVATRDLGIPLIHLSTDYVFDGTITRPYAEDDAVAPLNVYGASKLAGENAVRTEQPDHVILRTSWIYSPYGKNFLRTMLRLAESRSSIAVVSDQIGSPTCAFHLAEVMLAVTRRLLVDTDPGLRGTFHAAGTGETSWADFARAIFEQAQQLSAPSASVTNIAATEFPSPTKRPAYSTLDGRKLGRTFGLFVPHWTDGVSEVMDHIVRTGS